MHKRRKLLGLAIAASAPFDDRIHHSAALSNLRLPLIENLLRQVGSDLLADAPRMDFAQLCRQMRIVEGPPEMLHPLNLGLMFFNPAPQKFFPQTQIDVVQFPSSSREKNTPRPHNSLGTSRPVSS